MSKFEQYDHFGNGVKEWVRSDLKDKHRNHCLCWRCEHFKPNDREENCPVANVLFSICVAFNIVTPVWECPEFEEDGKDETNQDKR